MMKKRNFLVSVLVCVAVMTGTTYAATITALNCEFATIQTIVNNAASGDTIKVPAGTCTWTTPAGCSAGACNSVLIKKSINLIGAGIDQTNIIDGTDSGIFYSPLYVSIGADQHVRISGFTFSDLGVNDGFGVIQIGSKGTIRIDHNKFNDITSRGIRVNGAFGVIDHNQFIKTSNGTFQGIFIAADFQTGWTKALPIGTADSLFIEDNTFTYDYPNDGALDLQDGATAVFRNNEISGAVIGTHGYDSTPRSSLWLEVYNNTISNPTGNMISPAAIQYRGGSGVVYNNTTSGKWLMAVGLANYRSCSFYSEISKGWCNGTTTTPIADGNTLPTETYLGWPCVDQVGRGTNQGSYPLYIWNNTWGGEINFGPVYVYNGSTGTCYTSTHIKINRDYFNGSTPMPGYSAYDYPHPLTKPIPPLNLRITN